MWIWSLQVWDGNILAVGLIDQRLKENKNSGWLETMPERYGEFYAGIVTVQTNQHLDIYAMLWDGGYSKTLSEIKTIAYLVGKHPGIMLQHLMDQTKIIPDSFINSGSRNKDWFWEEIEENKIPKHVKKILQRILEKMACLYANDKKLFEFVKLGTA